MPDEPIQICSIDTLYRRRMTPDAELIVIDEAHLATSEGYRWFVNAYPEAFFLPVSATPHSKRGFRHIADEVVHPISMKDLILHGFLVSPIYYVPSKPDLAAVEIDKKTHDYKQDQLEKVMKSTVIYGHIINSWKRLGENRSTLCFAVSIEHSKELCESFNKAGIPAEHIEADTPLAERHELIKNLETGKLKVLCNVGTLTTGVDIPSLGCIVLARPTKSYNLYIQMLGRGTRICEGKENFIVLDHASNLIEHGFIEEERKCYLDGSPSKPQENSVIHCSRCWHAWNPIEQFRQLNPALEKIGRDYICRAMFNGELCLNDMTPAKVPITFERVVHEIKQAEMIQIKDDLEIKKMQARSYAERKAEIARRKGYKAGWVYYQLRDKYGDEIAEGIWKSIRHTI